MRLPGVTDRLFHGHAPSIIIQPEGARCSGGTSEPFRPDVQSPALISRGVPSCSWIFSRKNSGVRDGCSGVSRGVYSAHISFRGRLLRPAPRSLGLPGVGPFPYHGSRLRRKQGSVSLHVTACKANPLGLHTRAFMDQHSVRICQSAGQHSVHTSQHSYANGLQTRLRANHHCEWHNRREINAFIGAPGFAAV
jgi:hypothetical protein